MKRQRYFDKLSRTGSFIKSKIRTGSSPNLALFLSMKQLICGLLCAGLCGSEAAAQQVIPPLKKQFLDSAWHVLPSAAGAHYRRETVWRDSTAGVVRDYFLSGQLQSQEEFDNIRTRRYDGVSEYFAKDGQLLSHKEFTHGEATGEHRRYYSGGQLKRREHYAAGKRLDGACFAANGAPFPISSTISFPYIREETVAQALLRRPLASALRIRKMRAAWVFKAR